jgi:hypothetical protein
MSGLCKTCVNSIWCDTWAEWKCKDLKLRINGDLVNCSTYKKRPKDFKEAKCQCEDCLTNYANED